MATCVNVQYCASCSCIDYPGVSQIIYRVALKTRRYILFGILPKLINWNFILLLDINLWYQITSLPQLCMLIGIFFFAFLYYSDYDL